MMTNGFSNTDGSMVGNGVAIAERLEQEDKSDKRQETRATRALGLHTGAHRHPIKASEALVRRQIFPKLSALRLAVTQRWAVFARKR